MRQVGNRFRRTTGATADCTHGHFQHHASQACRCPSEKSYLLAAAALTDTFIAFACARDEQICWGQVEEAVCALVTRLWPARHRASRSDRHRALARWPLLTVGGSPVSPHNTNK